MSKLIYLVPLFPLIGFLINGLGRKSLSKTIIGIIGSGAILASFIVSLVLFFDVKAHGGFTATAFNFINIENFNGSTPLSIAFAFQVDQLSALFLLIITGIGFLIHLYSSAYMHEEEPKHFGRYFAYLNLFVFSMLLLVLGANYVIMFIGWEGVGLCSYLLIGYWFKNDNYNYAAKKAFVMNRIGDLGFLLGMFFMLFYFGSIDYSTVANQAQTLAPNSALLITITMLLFVGAMGKSAQLPLFTWLPDAMAGPTPVSALIHAATMVTAGIYMIVRSNILFSLAPTTLTFILIVGVATSVFAAVIGLLQNDIKKVLAYSTVSQLGLMFAALGLGAFSSGMFHVVTHAFFKALLFLGAGSVIHALHGEQDIRKMGGLGKYIKVTYITFLLASLAISGFPFLSGFFSKDEILAHAFEQNKTIWVILSISSFITAFYMFRLVFLTFFGNFRGTEETKKHIHESPITMTLPLIVLCILAVVGGLLGLPEVFHVQHVFSTYLSSVTEGSAQYLVHHEKVSHATEIALMSFAGIGAIVVILFAYNKYVKQNALPADEVELTGLNKVISNKFYVDEIYETVFVKPITVLSDLFLVLVDKLIIDLAVNATAWIVATTGKTMRLLQTGNTGFYVFAMVIGMMVLLIIRLFI